MLSGRPASCPSNDGSFISRLVVETDGPHFRYNMRCCKYAYP